MPPRSATEHLESLKDPLSPRSNNGVTAEDDEERAEEPVLRFLSLRQDSSLWTTTTSISNQEENDGDGDDDNLQEWHSGNQTNVKYIMMYTLFAFAGRSLWSQSVLSLFVSLLRNDNPEAVGFITAVMGMAQLVASFPAGILADMYSRAAMLKIASVSGMLAVSATLMACWYGRYTSLMMALLCWGITYGIADTLLIALLADSVRDGERSYYFTQRQMLLTLGNISGPLVALSMFAFLGNNWTIRDCSLVMAVAQLVCLPAVIILCFFRDVKIQGEFNLPQQQDENDQIDDEEHGGAAAWTFHQPLLCAHDTSSESGESTQESEDNNHHEQEQSSNDWSVCESRDDDLIPKPFFACCIPRHRIIPTLIASSDVISGLGAGMSIRYFPLFFVNQLQLGPVQVQILYIVAPIVQMILTKTSQTLSKTFGRCHVTVLFRWTGILLMLSMVSAYSLFHAPVWLVCILYVFRTGFMNSCGALTRSMLMDHVPSHERGKWSSLESVNSFSWSGSAALGGILVRMFGIQPLFVVTALVQFISSLIVLSIFPADSSEGQEEPRRNWTNPRSSSRRDESYRNEL